MEIPLFGADAQTGDFNMTATALITNRIRRLIGDTVETYRWSNEVLLVWLNECREALYAIHPEAFYVDEIVIAYPGDLALSGTLDVTEDFRSIVTNYVAYRALSEDSEDPETRQDAGTYIQKFLGGI